jgi:2-isopropylmalate synthase
VLHSFILPPAGKKGLAMTSGMDERDRIVIFDTTLRDGEQAAGIGFSVQDKLDIADELAAMGVDVIEAGFAAASDVEADAIRRIAARVRGSRVCSLSRAVAGDIEAAARALEPAEKARIHVFLSASEVQMAAQLGRSQAQVLDLAEQHVAAARRHVDDVEFSPMDATRADPEFVVRMASAAVRAGASTVNIPDTVGFATPDLIAALIGKLRASIPAFTQPSGPVLSFHGQDDLGLATANALSAIGAGARQVELTVNGIGERAGNTPLEEVVMALHVHGERMGVYTAVRTERIHALSRLVEARSAMAIAANKAIVGLNAFRHASGVHQDGVIKRRETYEVFDPALIGHPRGTEIVLGKLSGRAGFAARARALGFPLRGAMLEHAFRRFQRVADTQRVVDDAQVAAICAEL